jgi:hypothetical protein
MTCYFVIPAVNVLIYPHFTLYDRIYLSFLQISLQYLLKNASNHQGHPVLYYFAASVTKEFFQLAVFCCFNPDYSIALYLFYIFFFGNIQVSPALE